MKTHITLFELKKVLETRGDTYIKHEPGIYGYYISDYLSYTRNYLTSGMRKQEVIHMSNMDSLRLSSKSTLESKTKSAHLLKNISIH